MKKYLLIFLLLLTAAVVTATVLNSTKKTTTNTTNTKKEHKATKTENSNAKKSSCKWFSAIFYKKTPRTTGIFFIENLSALLSDRSYKSALLPAPHHCS